jgi:hypothetical protein
MSVYNQVFQDGYVKVEDIGYLDNHSLVVRSVKSYVIFSIDVVGSNPLCYNNFFLSPDRKACSSFE